MLAAKRAAKRSLPETALAAMFNGNCHSCGKFGHRSKDCPDKKAKGGNDNGNGGSNNINNNSGGNQSNKNSGKPKFNGNCNICGKFGHKGADCWRNEANKDKRPSWWKNPRGAAAVDNGASSNTGGKFVLCGLTTGGK